MLQRLRKDNGNEDCACGGRDFVNRTGRDEVVFKRPVCISIPALPRLKPRPLVKMSIVKVHVSSPDSFSERTYALDLLVGQLKVSDAGDRRRYLG